MLKNKIIIRKIRNIVILFMALIIMLGAYNNIRNSRAEDVVSVNVIATDCYGYLKNDVLKLEAKQIGDDLYEVSLPKDVNTKKINEILSVKVNNEQVEIIEPVIDNTEVSDDHLEDDTKKIHLTKKQVKNGNINIEIQYDIGIRQEKEDGTFENILLISKTREEIEKIKITEKTQILVNRILTYQDIEKDKLIELSGLLPIDAYIQVEEVTQEKLKEIFGDGKINFAYDIKIMQDIISEVPVDEANPDGEKQQIKETIEINPEDYGSSCNVKIMDPNIFEETKIYHVKEDNKYEKLEKRDGGDGNLTFKAETFSIYAGSDDSTVDDGAELGARESVGPTLKFYKDSTSNYIATTKYNGTQGTWWTNAETLYVYIYCGTSGESLGFAWGYTDSVTITETNSSGFTSSSKAYGRFYAEQGRQCSFCCDGHGSYWSWPTVEKLQIDRTVPTISSATATLASNVQSSTIKITATDSWVGDGGGTGPAGIGGYSFDNGATWQTSSSKSVTANGTYTVKVKDKAGNISASKTVTVSGIVAASAPTFSLSISPTGWTNGNVTVKATVSNNGGVAISGYNFNSAGYQTSNSKAFGANGKVTVVVKNQAGKTATKSIEISNIDKTKPTAGTLKMKLNNSSGSDYTNNTWTNKSVYIEAVKGTDTGGSGHKSTTYTVNSGEAKATGTAGAQTLTEHGTYTIKVTTTDNATNSATRSYTVNIDKTAPTISAAWTVGGAAYNSTWTNQAVNCTVTYNGGSSGIKPATLAYTADGGTNWRSFTDNTSTTTYSTAFSAERNSKTIQFRIQDNAGNWGYSTGKVLKIDKTMPTATGLTFSETYTKTGKITVTAEGLADNASGINHVDWYLKNSAGEKLLPGVTSDGQWYKNIDVSSYPEGTYTVGIVIYDNANNYNDTTWTDHSDSHIGYLPFVYDKTPPSTTLLVTSNGSSYSGAWTNKDVTADFSFSDSLSGINATTVQVSTNGGAFSGDGASRTSPYTATYSTEQNSTYAYRVQDNAGNWATTKTFAVKIDKTKPTATGITLSETYTKTGQITATATGVTDNLSGMTMVYWYLINSDNERLMDSAVSDGEWYKNIDVSSYPEGQYFITIALKDKASNINDTSNPNTTTSYIGWISFYYDKTPPTAGTLSMKLGSIDGSDYTNDTWTNQSVYVYANDGTDATTTATTTYSVNGGSAKGSGTGNATPLTETGTYTITVTTTDSAGNSASSGTYTVKVDKTGPTITVVNTVNGSTYSGGWTNQDVVANLTFSDGSGSGVDATKLEVTTSNGSFWKKYTSNVSTSSYTDTWSNDLNSVVQYRIKDNVGNWGYSPTFDLKIDKTVPTPGTLQMKLDTATGSDYTNDTWTNHSVAVWAENGSDALSDHGQTTYSINGGTAIPSGESNQTQLSTTGIYSIVVTTTDNAGNSASSSAYTVKVDKTDPTVGSLQMKLDTTSGSDYTNNTWTKQSVVVWAENGSDAHSQHASTTYSVDGGTAKGSGTANATTLNSTGTYSIVVTTTDVAGNSASSSAYTVKVDKTDPTVGTLQMKLDTTSGSAYTNNTWTKSSVVIWAVNGSDAHSQHGTTTYSIDGGTAKGSGTANATTLSTTGTYSVVVTTTDVAGNSASSSAYTIKIDKVAPTVGILQMKIETLTGNNYVNDTWTTSNVVVYADAGSDTHSGHAETTYSINGGTAKGSGTANATTISTSGTYSIVVTTKDAVGNTTSSESGMYTVKIDRTPPSAPTTMEFSFSDWTRYNQGTWTNKDVYAAYSSSQNGPTGATDDHSGVAKYQISTDNSSWADYSYNSSAAMYKMSTEGTYTRYFRAVDAVGNAGPSISRTAKIDKTKPVWATQNFNVNRTTQTVTVDLVGTDALSGIASSTLQPSNITVYVDGEVASNITVAVGTATTVTGGIKHTLTLTGWEQSTRNANNYKNWSGTVQLKVTAGSLTDVGGNANNEQTLTAGYADVIKPDIKYSHQSTDIDKGNKKYVMTFTITDKYYTSGVLDADDLEITMQNGQVDSNGDLIVYDLKDEPVTITLRNSEIRVSSMKMTNTSNSIVTATNQLIGHTYTLTIEGLEKLGIEEGDTTANYSGIINVQLAADQISDRATNKNIQKTITSGVDVPGGSTGDEVVVDVVDPLLTRDSSSTDVINKTSTITIDATDTYFASSSLTNAKLEVYVDGVKTTTGITVNISAPTALNETRIENGTTKTVKYGNKYTITITGFATSVKQLKIKVLSGVATDASGNTNKDTEFQLYNTLRVAADNSGNYESEGTSKFLNETVASGKTAIQRQNIHKVVFVNSISGSTAAGVKNVWDVSAVGDNTILAWYSESSAPYTVYIGSEGAISANQDSSYLFSYIGHATSSTETAPISGLNLLDTYAVTKMDCMFSNFGHAKMTTLNLGNFDTSNVTSMKKMFEKCGYTAMTALNLGNEFDTTKVTNMSEMFKECGYKAMITLTFGSQFNTTAVTDMTYMFSGTGHDAMTSLNLGSSFYTTNVTDMTAMFQNCGYKAMASLTLGSNFNTTNVTLMTSMFENCGHDLLPTLNLGSNFNTTKVTDMSLMFAGTGYGAMTTLDLGANFHTNNVLNMSGMFQNCGYTKMTTLNLGTNFDTSKVTDMSYMFENTGHTKLTSLDLGNKFYTTEAENMSYMFYKCGNTAMVSLDLGPKFTRIAEDSTEFATDCGASGATIYAPESIYSNKNGFKKNND